MKKNLLFSFVFLLTGFVQPTNAQLEHSLVFLNLKKSIPTNFINGEYQIGTDEMHFLILEYGFHFSSYNSKEFSPYYTGTVLLDPYHEFTQYKSKKMGMNAGIGYNYYFKDIENEERFIPLLGLGFNWFRDHDNYTLEYTNQLNGNISNLEKEHNFHTLSSYLQGGFLFVSGNMYLKTSLLFEYYLPINEAVYMATDKYNARSGTKLPLAGIEPSLQLGIGFKLF